MINGWSPLGISLWVTAWAGTLALVAGTALALILVRFKFRGKTLLEGLTLLPLILPPTVLGYYLLVMLGQRGLGPITERFLGFRFVFAWPGAVIAAGVAALPLVVQAARASLATVSREIEDAARVDGCNRWRLFWNITLPLAWRGIAAGGLLGYLRALGDFGATLMVAGNIPGRTQTLSMAIYDAVQANNVQQANTWVIMLSLIAFSFLTVVLKLNQQVVGEDA
jgi:molybdate transport system permease protein